jgi:hypothetical protein
MPKGIPKLKEPRVKKVVVPGKHCAYHTDFRDRILTDMRRYFRYTDWASMWTEWYQSVGEDGRRKYRTVYQFVKEKAESKEQFSFLAWYLGPKPFDDEKDEHQKKYSFVPDGPEDWVKRRNENGWYTSKNLEKFTAEIRRRDNVLDAMQEAGRTVTLSSIARAEKLAQRIDQYFQGEPLLEGASLAENTSRAGFYLRLQRDVMGLQERAFNLFAKSHGVNFEDMSGLVHLMTASAMAASVRQSEGKEISREQAAVKSIVEMTLAKSSRYQLPIPKDAEDKIVEAAAQYEVVAKKKRNVQ